MTPNRPISIESRNLSVAWAKSFLSTLSLPNGKSPPLVLGLTGFEKDKPPENLAFRGRVDEELKANGKVPVLENAYTIFPYGTWKRKDCRGPGWLFDRYLQLYPRLKARDKRHRYGTYFQRMINYTGLKGAEQKTINQLEHLLKIWHRDLRKGRRTRNSALQISCLDPAKDHTGQPVRGFPCLQQVSFSWDSDGGLCVSAYYPTQYIFDRGYGNYLGLCQLGEFMAHEMGLELVRLNCFVASPLLGGVTKKRLENLKHDAISITAAEK